MNRLRTRLLILGFFLPGVLFGQPSVEVTLFPSLNALQPGASMQLAARIEIERGWHINAHQPAEDFLIPTELVLDVPPGCSVGEVKFPAPVAKTFAFWPRPLQVYEGVLLAYSELRLSDGFGGDSLRIRGFLRFQACNDSTCSPPAEVPVSLTIPVVPRHEPVFPVNDSLFAQLGKVRGGGPGEDTGLAGVIARKGMFVAFLLLFVGGLALNLTPCVYPLVPITVSYFGAQQNRNLAQALGKSSAYVLGMAVMYSVLGVVAATTGGLFGASLQNPWVLGFVALVFVALALSFFGLYELQPPAWLMGAASVTKGGYLGSFLMGVTVGIVAAPCIGPFILALLTYVAATGDPWLGFWMFFVLALGLGVPYLILGTFSGALSRLPQSGPWMIWVRKIFGVVLLGMAVYFLRPLTPPTVHRALLAGLALGAGVYLGWLERTRVPGLAFRLARWVAGTGGILLAAWLSLRGGGGEKGIPWQAYKPEAIEAARELGKPIILDFSAEWCVACRELEHKTFSDRRVRDRARSFVTLQADLTRYGSPSSTALRKQFGILGLPTVVFLLPDGTELRELRVVGFVSPEEFLLRMEKALARAGDRPPSPARTGAGARGPS
ncbi:MAG: thioredoxin family protein [candidate division KSB1 bacterium]|nr:thioredoxin family protein [candidate division KSB1 bacterium]